MTWLTLFVLLVLVFCVPLYVQMRHDCCEISRLEEEIRKHNEEVKRRYNHA